MRAKQLRGLVTGATGYIAGRLVPKLLDHGFSVRALARTEKKLAGVQWRKSIEVTHGDSRVPPGDRRSGLRSH